MTQNCWVRVGILIHPMIVRHHFQIRFASPDFKGERVVLNQYRLGEHKDHVRIVQEQLRMIEAIAKVVSDALVTCGPIG